MTEIHDLLKELVDSDDDFLAEQAAKVKLYLDDLERGVITEELCRSYVQDIRDLLEISKLRDTIKRKALAQKAIDQFTKLLMKGVTSAIKGVF